MHKQGVHAVWIYLRVLMAIDTEVVDREIAHSDPEYQRNTLLKDAMGEHSVQQMVDSWYHIIVSFYLPTMSFSYIIDRKVFCDLNAISASTLA